MLALLDVISVVLRLFVWVVIIQAILSWLVSFGVVNASNQVVSTIWRFTHQLTEPFLKPIRQRLPNFNGMDLSPIVLLLIIFFIQSFMVRYLYPAVANAGL